VNLTKLQNSKLSGKIQNAVKAADNLRMGSKTEPSIDLSFEELIQNQLSTEETPLESVEDLYQELGIDSSVDTISNLYSNTGDTDIRWVIPEIIREAVLVGLRTAPIWNNVTASEQPTSGLTQTMPHINMSDAAPRRVGEAETIPLGNISYGQKTFSIYKFGRGIKIPYEVMQYTTIDAIGIFLRDFGVKLGHALDVMAIDVLINGEQTNGSEAAPVIGTANGTSKTYKDMLKLWIRGSRIGRNFTTIIGGEDAALDTLDMEEFKTPRNSGTTRATLNLRTPLPNAAEYFVHGNVPANQEIMVDTQYALMKFNAQALLVEGEKIVSNQTEAVYVTITTGFAKMFRDAAVILDKSVTFAANGFPSYMDVDSVANVTIN